MLDASQIYRSIPAPRALDAIALVAADDPIARTKIACALRYAGYFVDEAIDGADALDQLGTALSRASPWLPDLVVLDLGRSQLTTIHVLAALHGAALGVPVIAVTQPELAAHARMLGATVVLEQPIRLLALLAALVLIRAPGAAADELATLVDGLIDPMVALQIEGAAAAPSSLAQALDRLHENLTVIGKLTDTAS